MVHFARLSNRGNSNEITFRCRPPWGTRNSFEAFSQTLACRGVWRAGQQLSQSSSNFQPFRSRQLFVHFFYHDQECASGALNVATGEVHSFREIAEKVVRLSGKAVAIQGSPRSGPMPHNGYRPFDVSACRAAFPDFRFTSLEQGLTLAGAR